MNEPQYFRLIYYGAEDCTGVIAAWRAVTVATDSLTGAQHMSTVIPELSPGLKNVS